MKIYCDCKNRKIETSCDKLRAGFTIACDENCFAKQDEMKKIAEENERIKREQEEQRNRQELEEFEKKFGKKKHKERKRQVVEEKQDAHLLKWAAASIAVIILSIFIYYIVFVQ